MTNNQQNPFHKLEEALPLLREAKQLLEDGDIILKQCEHFKNAPEKTRLSVIFIIEKRKEYVENLKKIIKNLGELEKVTINEREVHGELIPHHLKKPIDKSIETLGEMKDTLQEKIHLIESLDGHDYLSDGVNFV